MGQLHSIGVLAQESGGGGGGFSLIIMLAIIAVLIAAMWTIFTKAGKPGWASLIPIYNVIVMLEIAGKPVWWIVLYMIPLVNVIVAIIVTIDLAKSFGKGTGFALGMMFLPFIFYPMLAFGDSTYQGA